MASKFTDEQVIGNLSRLYNELDEAGGEDGAEFDLDLLFSDVLRACGLMSVDNLNAIIGRENTTRAVTMVALPEELALSKPEGPYE